MGYFGRFILGYGILPTPLTKPLYNAWSLELPCVFTHHLVIKMLILTVMQLNRNRTKEKNSQIINHRMGKKKRHKIGITVFFTLL